MAVATAGSRATGAADSDSDLDLYIYTDSALPLAASTGAATAQHAGTMLDDLDALLAREGLLLTSDIRA